jgi:hypothetical protein
MQETRIKEQSKFQVNPDERPIRPSPTRNTFGPPLEYQIEQAINTQRVVLKKNLKT